MKIETELMSIMDNFKTICHPNNFKDKDAYANWLAQTYFFVTHSTPLLGCSLPHLRNNKELQFHFEHHLSEEERHELLILKDLKNMGRDISEFEEHPLTTAFYQSQYYRVNFEGGTSLLGYILFLEGLAAYAGKSVYQEIKDLHKGSALFLKVHAEEDPEHLYGAIMAISKLSENEQNAILKNLKYSSFIYEGIMSATREVRIKKAA